MPWFKMRAFVLNRRNWENEVGSLSFLHSSSLHPCSFVSFLPSLLSSPSLFVISNLCTDVILPVYSVPEQRGWRLSPPITYTGSARLTQVRERCCSVHPFAGSLCPLTQSSERSAVHCHGNSGGGRWRGLSRVTALTRVWTLE